ncbi:MAG TPA: hypothetical protein VGK24_10715 [Candidatus Angelobacter sp.]
MKNSRFYESNLQLANIKSRYAFRPIRAISIQLGFYRNGREGRKGQYGSN